MTFGVSGVEWQILGSWLRRLGAMKTSGHHFKEGEEKKKEKKKQKSKSLGPSEFHWFSYEFCLHVVYLNDQVNLKLLLIKTYIHSRAFS